MKSKCLKITQQLTNRRLREYLFRVFRSKLNSDYYIVKTKILTTEGYIDIGKKFVVNVKDREEIKSYINHVSDYFYLNSKNLSNKNIERVCIYYTETTKDIYDKFHPLDFKSDFQF